MYKNIKVEIESAVGYIIINRPKVRNALDDKTINEIQSAFESFEYDEDIRCVVVTGMGDKAFVSGADIKSLNERNSLHYLQNNTLQDVYDYIERFNKPTVAMINGHALGGGFELALACDIRVMASHAKVGLPELKLGIIPGAGGTQRLSRIIGKGKAIEMILTGNVIDAEEALSYNLISTSVDKENLRETTLKYVNEILKNGPIAAQLAKLTINMGFNADMKTGLLIEKLAQSIIFSTSDRIEGTNAFLEKRNPNFINK